MKRAFILLLLISICVALSGCVTNPSDSGSAGIPSEAADKENISSSEATENKAVLYTETTDNDNAPSSETTKADTSLEPTDNNDDFSTVMAEHDNYPDYIRSVLSDGNTAPTDLGFTGWCGNISLTTMTVNKGGKLSIYFLILYDGQWDDEPWDSKKPPPYKYSHHEQ